MTEKWYEGPLLGFDTETTGVSLPTDRIVQAALVTVDLPEEAQPVGAWSGRTWLIDPGVPIPAGASRVHGITDEQVKADGLPPAEALSEVSASLSAAVAAGTPVVAFRAAFDLTMLAYELDRHGLPQLDWAAIAVIDPSVLDKRADKYRRGKRTLGVTCDHYGVPLDGAHSANGDAAATVALARAIGARYPDLGGMDARELRQAQAEWFAEDAASLEAYFKRKGRDETVDRRWPLAR